jgi:hypothetical protein
MFALLNDWLIFNFIVLDDWLVVDDGSLAVMLTEFMASFKVLIFSKSIPFGDFFVVVLHS